MKKIPATFSKRGFVSVLMALCFTGLAVSGIVLYFAPPCSLAANTNWTMLALSKVQWSSLHQVAALFILILAVTHLFVFNWKTFMCYLRRRRSRLRKAEQEFTAQSKSAKFRIPIEVVSAIVVAVILYAGAITMVAPFGWLHEGSDAIKDQYRQEAPAGTGRGTGPGEGRRSGQGSALEFGQLPGDEQN